jgi:hypothetical protein
MVIGTGFLSGVLDPGRKRYAFGTLRPWQENPLAEVGDVGEARSARKEFPQGIYAARRFGGFCMSGVLSAVSVDTQLPGNAGAKSGVGQGGRP